MIACAEDGSCWRALAKQADVRDMADEITGLFDHEKLRGNFLESVTRKLG